MPKIGALPLRTSSKMIRAVLDTNVFISALFWRGSPHHVLQKGLGGDFLIIISSEVLKEINDTLHRKFRFPVDDTNAFIEVITVNSYIVEPEERVRVVAADPSDNKVVECAIAGKAHFIVSGDRHLLDLREYRGIKVTNARKFLSLL